LKRIFLEIRCLPEFKKDIHKLSRRFKTIEDDLRIFIEKELKLFHKLKIDNKGIFHIPGLQIENPKIFKAKNLPVVLLKGKEFILA